MAVYSDADRNTMHVALADEAIRYNYPLLVPTSHEDGNK